MVSNCNENDGTVACFGLKGEMDRMRLFRRLLPSAVKLSFDSMIVNITELHVTVQVDTDDSQDSSEHFDFCLTNNVQYELEWSYSPNFSPRYKVADNVSSNFFDMLLHLLKESCNQVECLYFGTCRFLNVSDILRVFQGKIKRLEILEWSCFSAAAVVDNDMSSVQQTFQTLECLEVAASVSRNTQRRQSVLTLIAALAKPTKLKILKLIGGDYTLPALPHFLKANPQLETLELSRIHLIYDDSLQDVFSSVKQHLHLNHLILHDLTILNTNHVVWLYESILSPNLTKLTVDSLSGHPSFVLPEQARQLVHIFQRAKSLQEIRFEATMAADRMELNSAEFLPGLLDLPILSSLEVFPCLLVDTKPLAMALSQRESSLTHLCIGSMQHNISDMSSIAVALSDNTTLNSLILSVRQVDVSCANLLGTCLAKQKRLQHFSLLSNHATENKQEAIKISHALARGIKKNISLKCFAYMCRFGVVSSSNDDDDDDNNDDDNNDDDNNDDDNNDDDDYRVIVRPFDQALEANKTINQIVLVSRANARELVLKNQVLLDMNRFGRQHFVDPDFSFLLWPRIMTKVKEQPNILFHMLKSTPTLVLATTKG